MITAQHRFRPRDEEVAAKVMDGEAILINLSNGIYYSMDKVGGLIWEMVETKRSLGDIAAGVAARYEVPLEQAQSDSERLLQELIDENLVVALEDGVEESVITNGEAAEKQPYEAPKLNIYRDMGDLLALDPPTPGLQDISWKETEDKSSKKD